MSQNHLDQPNYKRTTEKQYSLLKQKMAIYLQQNKNKHSTSKYNKDILYWKDLTEKLNKLGPPYRTLQQWKKVWSDFKRSEMKRKSKSKLDTIQSVRAVKMQSNNKNANIPKEMPQKQENKVIQTDYAVKPMIKSEIDEYEENSESMQMTYSNDYSYEDEQSMQDPYTNESVIPDESSCGSYNYNASQDVEDSTQQSSLNQRTSYINYNTPPPLQPSNIHLQDQHLYALQNQMEHQTKLLEHMSQMSSTMAGLMQRQTHSIEKQTIAILRQAAATEKHTMVMNTFLDMIKTKMQNGNLQKNNTTSKTKPENDIL